MPKATSVEWVWCLVIALSVSANLHMLCLTGPHAPLAWTSLLHAPVAKCGAVVLAVTFRVLVDQTQLAVSHSASKDAPVPLTVHTGTMLASGSMVGALLLGV